MAKVEVGSKAINFTYETPYKQGEELAKKVLEADKTIIHFSRYFGCTACKVSMFELKEAYDKIKAKNAQVLFVLQSQPSVISEALKEGDYPFDIVCDPEMKLYPLYELPAAASMEAMVPASDGEKMEKMKKVAVANRFAHGAYEGEELQLPGVFIVDKDLNVLYAKRAASLFDIPDAEEILELI